MYVINYVWHALHKVKVVFVCVTVSRSHSYACSDTLEPCDSWFEDVLEWNFSHYLVVYHVMRISLTWTSWSYYYHAYLSDFDGIVDIELIRKAVCTNSDPVLATDHGKQIASSWPFHLCIHIIRLRIYMMMWVNVSVCMCMSVFSVDGRSVSKSWCITVEGCAVVWKAGLQQIFN